MTFGEDFIDAYRMDKSPALDDWLEVSDIIREFEQEHGLRIGADATKRMKAIARKTSGYVKFPLKYPVPTREDIQGYFDNFKLYQKKR